VAPFPLSAGNATIFRELEEDTVGRGTRKTVNKDRVLFNIDGIVIMYDVIMHDVTIQSPQTSQMYYNVHPTC
jgi:hypothetical protein